MNSTKGALVIGEALIDIVEQEHGVEKPVEVVGGSPANVALGLARLGHNAELLTYLGRDARGERIAAELRGQGVVVKDESFSAERTTTAHALIADDGTATYTFDIGWRLSAPHTTDASVVHAGSLALFLEPGAARVREILGNAPETAVVSLDPNIRPDLLHDHDAIVESFEQLAMLADIVKLSDEDAQWMYPGRNLSEVAERIQLRGPRLVVVTLGAQGAFALAELESGQHVTARVAIQPGPLVDTISAGDSFMACLLSSVLDHGLEACLADVEGMLRRASCASAIAVSKAGANPPTRAALDALAAGDTAVLVS